MILKRGTQTMSEKTTTNNQFHDLERECCCLFCGGKFKAKEIEFCVKLPETPNFYDQEFENAIKKYKGCEDMDAPYRAWIDWANDDGSNVLIWEDDLVPIRVKGPLRDISVSQISSLGFGLNFYDLSEDEEKAEEESDDDRIWRQSSMRVCPHCHMTLPRGFILDKVIRIGLIGGPRSGKTTYMVVATKYLQERLHGMGNGVGLGTITLVEECEAYIDKVYKEGIKPTLSKAGQEEDPRVLPLIMRITPSNKAYAPFTMILQDIPGEYMRPEPQYQEMLSSSNINESTDLIMFIDINHFIETRQIRELNKDPDSKKYGQYCTLKINRLFDNLENLGMCLKAQTLKSIQISLTKLDFWKEEDPRINYTVFGKNGDERHKNAISEKRLRLVHEQIQAALNQFSTSTGENDGAEYGKLLNVMKEHLNIKDAHPESAYTAVASKTVPEHENDFQSGIDVNFARSLNVLEPLLNIFAFHHLLPVKGNSIEVIME